MAAQEIQLSNRLVTDDQLRNITSFDEAVALANAIAAENGNVKVESMDDYGTGFAVAEKEALIGVQFIALQWAFRPDGDFGEFVSVELVTKAGDKVVINDGGAGICRQLKEITAAREKEGVANTHSLLGVPNGLTRSDFFYKASDPQGEKFRQIPEGAKKGEYLPGSTYYLAY